MLKHTPLSFPNLHYQQLRKVCHLKPAQLAKMYGLQEFTTPEGKYWYKDNGTDILGVAHLDTVLPFLHFEVSKLRPDTLIYCTTLDDRLGAYILLDWLAKSGAKYDILLTENEEQGRSTATAFKPPKDKKYNWTFSFDRRGEDVATYQYYSVGFAQALMKHGAESVVHGTYSCIVDLEHLGVRGANFGIGYHGEHGAYCYASKRELLAGLRRFQSFYREYQSIAFPFETEEILKGASSSVSYSSAKEHKVVSELSKRELIKEFREKRKAKEQDKKEDKGIAKAIEALLQQNVSILHIKPATVSCLYDNELYLVKDVVEKSRVELLKLDGFTFLMVEDIEKAITPLGLSFAMSLKAYNLPIVSIKITSKDDQMKTGKVNQNIILALPDRVKSEGTVLDSLRLPDKALVSHPKKLELSTRKIQGSEDNPDYQRVLENVEMQECPQCHTMVSAEEIDEESKLCEICHKERAEAYMTESAFADTNCLVCGDIAKMEDLDDNLHCVKCAKEKAQQITEEKGGSIMAAAFKLNRSKKYEDLKYTLTEKGFQWVSISPLKKVRVGFPAKPEEVSI